jgi:hypothetical protein
MNLKLLTIAISTFLLFSNIALAIPGGGHQFYGSVTINGSPAPDGTTVTAKINGIDVSRVTTSGGKYSLSVSDPYNTRSGSEISFFVNEVNTGKTAYFCNFCIGIGTNQEPLDLAITVATQSSGGTSSSGSSGFVPSGGTTTTETEEETESCQVRWLCEDWSECIDGEQTRVCEDVNNCGTEYGKPLMIQPCGEEEAEVTGTAEASVAGPTGFFLGLTSTEWLIGIIIGIIVAVIIVFLLTRKRR